LGLVCALVVHIFKGMNQEVGIQLEKSINTNVRNNTFNILQLETDFFKLGKYTYILYRS